MSDSPHRSFEKIGTDDLSRLAALAHEDLSSLFVSGAKSSVYADRCILMCLCQGAADHFVFGKKGVQDFDVWAFFSELTEIKFPYRRIGRKDFGASKFGRNPDDKDSFKGRRVDIMGRSIAKNKDESAGEAVQRYIKLSKAKSPCCLRQKPMIAIWPDQYFGLNINQL